MWPAGKHGVLGFIMVMTMLAATCGRVNAGGESMLKAVELQGSHYEIGKGWGEAFRDDMSRIVEIELGTTAALLGTDMETVIALGKRYLPLAEAYDPEFIHVLQGFARGAGVDFDTLFAIRTVLEVLFRTARPEGMCTSFAATGSATRSGKTILGQNIDWHPDLPLALLKITWPNGVRQLALSMSGVWEYGLTDSPGNPTFGFVSTLTASMDERPEDPTIPISVIMGKAGRMPTLEEALGEFKKNGLNLASFLLADGGGNLTGIELGLRNHVILEPEDDMLAHANHYLSEQFGQADIFLPFVPDSPLRYERLKALMKKHHGDLTPEHMMRFLADHENHPKGICSHVDPNSELPPSATVASVIMIPAERTLYVAVGNPCENEYHAFTLDAP